MKPIIFKTKGGTRMAIANSIDEVPDSISYYIYRNDGKKFVTRAKELLKKYKVSGVNKEIAKILMNEKLIWIKN